MPHKIDRKRHRQTVKRKVREIKQRYMALTQNDTIEPDKALAALKDSEQVDLARRLAGKLARRGVYVKFAPER